MARRRQKDGLRGKLLSSLLCKFAGEGGCWKKVVEEESRTLFPSPSPEVGTCASEPPWLRNYSLIRCLGAQVVPGDTRPRLGKPTVSSRSSTSWWPLSHQRETEKFLILSGDSSGEAVLSEPSLWTQKPENGNKRDFQDQLISCKHVTEPRTFLQFKLGPSEDECGPAV